MVTPRIACAVAVICLMGCAQNAGVEDPQRMLVSAASEKLRNEFNQPSGGPCEAIEATAAFREDQSPDEWLRQCQGLKTSLGAWQMFNLQSTTPVRWSSHILSAEGLAVFAKGSREIKLLWDLRDGRTELIQFEMERAGRRWLSVPSRSGQIGLRLQDSPIKPSTGEPFA